MFSNESILARHCSIDWYVTFEYKSEENCNVGAVCTMSSLSFGGTNIENWTASDYVWMKLHTRSNFGLLRAKLVDVGQ